MINTLLTLADKYGLDIAQLALIGFGFWKLATNHLKHMADDIKGISTKIQVVEKDIGNIKERVSKIEGKIEK